MARKNGGMWVKAKMEGYEAGKKAGREETMREMNKNKGGCMSVIVLMIGLVGTLSLIIKMI